MLRWLEQPGVRLVELDGEWACPVGGARPTPSRLDRDAARGTSSLPAAGAGGRPPAGLGARPAAATRPASRPPRRLERSVSHLITAIVLHPGRGRPHPRGRRRQIADTRRRQRGLLRHRRHRPDRDGPGPRARRRSPTSSPTSSTRCRRAGAPRRTSRSAPTPSTTSKRRSAWAPRGPHSGREPSAPRPRGRPSGAGRRRPAPQPSRRAAATQRSSRPAPSLVHEPHGPRIARADPVQQRRRTPARARRARRRR